jgi:hypothetical protein
MGITVVIAGCFISMSCALATDGEKGRLEVRGKELLFNGKPVMLRGVAVGDPILGRQGRPLSDYTVLARDWHANVVRLAIHPGVWKKQPHEEVMKRLEKEVQAALKEGMFVIIDWHAIGWPDGYYQAGRGDNADMYDSHFALAKDFWSAAAARFGSEGRVLFELWNEPVFQKNEYAPQVGQKWPQFKPLMKELTDLIRKQSKNVIIVTSNRWAHYLKGIRHDLLEGENIAYAWHIYAGHEHNNEKSWADALDDLQMVAPVLVTEWGFQRDTKQHYKGSAEDFGAKFVRDFLDGKQLHSTAWCWHADWGPPMLERDWRTPNEFGKFVLDYLRSNK